MDIGIVTSLKTGMQYAGLMDYVEENVGSFLKPGEDEESFSDSIKLAEKAGIPVPAVCCFVPGSIKSVGPELDMDVLLKWAETVFTRARRIGTEIVVYGSGASRNIPEGFPKDEAWDQFIELLKQMGPLAESSGVTVVLEPLNTNETNLINSVSEGGDIVRAVSHSHIRLLADIYHMAVDGEPADAILSCGELLEHTHCAEQENRAAPGTAGFDFVPYLLALKESGYNKRISIECKWKNMEEEASGAIEYLTNQLRKAGYKLS
jgi:sugar phosphate isomerase/epimerase